MRHALDSLTLVVPEWTREQRQPEWIDRYGSRAQNYRLPKSHTERDEYAEQVGANRLALMQAVCDPGPPKWLTKIPAERILH
jgi:transposase